MAKGDDVEECDWIMGMMNVGLTCCRKILKVGKRLEMRRNDVEVAKKKFGVRDTGFIMIRHPT